jgi:hypothetical protein
MSSWLRGAVSSTSSSTLAVEGRIGGVGGAGVEARAPSTFLDVELRVEPVELRAPDRLAGLVLVSGLVLAG